jgi:hypothetical protein
MLPHNPKTEPDVTKIFTMAYGGEADVNTFQEISVASNAIMYKGNPENIEKVCLSISSYF